ncbi:MAG: ABC transporter ATP-binding protein [Clostridia bacterium]|nr:ABC transporter ATP-binding protein [Clostridia bacterium]
MAKEKAKKGTLKRVLRYIGRYKILLGITLFFAALSVFLTLLFPILIGDAIDLIVGKGQVDMAGITDILWQAFFIVLLTALVNWGMTSLNNRMTYQIARDLRNDAFEKLETLPLSYLDSHPSGDIVSRIIADVDTFSDGLLLGFSQLFTGVVTILGTLVFMLVINWKVALVVFLLTPLSLFVAKFIGNRTYKMFSLQSKTKGEQTAIIDETVGNLKLVKAFSQEEELLEKFDEVNGRLGKCSLSAIFYSSLVNPTTRFVNSVVYAAVAMVGALAVIATQDAEVAFTVGELTCLLSYTNQYTKPFNEISGVLTEFQNALASASRLFDLLDEPSEIPDDADAFVMEEAEGEVSFDDVSFSYSKDKKLIEDFSVSVMPGQRIAIVGPTGCGKTTVINLLMRFYDVDQGKITVDGHDLRKVTRHSFRKQVGMVLQDTWLKAGTVHDNIAFGRPSASRDEVIAAAKAAHAHSFIKRLPKGYDTVIKEGGDGLSQGQKQLLCIARVMLTLPPMLILDEATSSIDTRTEIRIQKAFADMMKGRTSFIVAHRLSTIMNCDKILVMREGNIVEQGSHTELLAKGGFYAELYNSQFAK